MDNPIFQAITSSPIVKIFLTLSVAIFIIMLLPSSPVMPFLRQIGELPYLNYINWIIPIGRCATVMAAWWTAVVTYYGISWILRQLGVVGS